MAHLVNEEYLYRENIDEYLDCLGKNIAEMGIGSHGGRIEAESEVGKGTKFTVMFY